MTMYFLGGIYLEEIFVCGGDKRSEYIKEYFEKMGYRVRTFGHGKEGENLKDAKKCDITVLGLPALKDGQVYMPLSQKKVTFGELLSALKSGSYLFGGRFTDSDISLAASFGITAIDYSEDEIFQTENALYTAEGALSTIVDNTDISLCGMKILVTGGGRISKAFCSLLGNVPCSADVYARRELQRTFFTMRGNKTLHALSSLSGYDVVVNTIPAGVFSREILATLDENALVVDLSARPGYVPKDICDELGIKLLYLPGIPLRSAPRSAGIAAAKAVERMYRWWGVKNTEGI